MQWETYTDAIFGAAWRMTGLCEPNGVNMHRRPDGTYTANAFILGRFLSHCGKDEKRVMRRMNNSIERLTGVRVYAPKS